MKLCIVPMKPLAAAKERLAVALAPEERRALSLAMLEDVVRAGAALDAVWVLVSDEDAAAVSRRNGAEPRPDPAPGEGLNASLDRATADAVAAGARGVLVLSADLATVGPDDALAIASAPGIAIAPDRSGRGTNALWRAPPDAIPVAFGAGSRRAHEEAARAAGIEPVIVALPGLALDVDAPSDLEDVLASERAPATRAALHSLGYPHRLGR